jgi:hypothetical protein
MINFINKLKHLPEKYMMNSVLENFTILQVSFSALLGCFLGGKGRCLRKGKFCGSGLRNDIEYFDPTIEFHQ